MSRFKHYLIGAGFGAAFMYVLLQYHVVHSQEGWFLVSRMPQHNLGMAYADIRRWDEAKWQERPELARALIANGSEDLISSSLAASENTPEKTAFSVERLRSTIGAGSAVQGEGMDSPGEPFNGTSGLPAGQRVFEADGGSRGIFQERAPASASANSRRSGPSAATDLPPLPGGRNADSASLRRFRDANTRINNQPDRNNDSDRNLIDSLFDSASRDSNRLRDVSDEGRSDVTGRIANRVDAIPERSRRELAEPLDQVAESFNRSVDSLSDSAAGALGNRAADGLSGPASEAGPFVRDEVGNAWERTSDTGFATDAADSELTPELRALRDRFDPFAN